MRFTQKETISIPSKTVKIQEEQKVLLPIGTNTHLQLVIFFFM